MANFDDETAVHPVGEGCWQGHVSANWSIGDVPNGGYVQALALAAIGRAVPHPHPLTATSHFLRPCTIDADALIEVEIVRRGRSVTTASSRLVQQGRERLRTLATYGDLGATSGPTAVSGRPPALPPPAASTGRGEAGLFPGGFAENPSIASRVDVRIDPSWVAVSGKPGESAGPSVDASQSGNPGSATAYAAWIRFSDGRAADAQALPLLVDALPPALFGIIEPMWVPTIELTTHVRAEPAPGWLRAAVSTRFVINGLFEEECELWDSQDRLVAMSRQLARVLSPPV